MTKLTLKEQLKNIPPFNIDDFKTWGLHYQLMRGCASNHNNIKDYLKEVVIRLRVYGFENIETWQLKQAYREEKEND